MPDPVSMAVTMADPRAWPLALLLSAVSKLDVCVAFFANQDAVVEREAADGERGAC
jgi:hypothetical protein